MHGLPKKLEIAPSRYLSFSIQEGCGKFAKGGYFSYMIAQISFGILVLISVLLLAIVVVVPSFISIINAQTSMTIFTEKENVTVPYINKDLNIDNTNDYGTNDNDSSTISPPFISPNPVGPAGRVNITANHSESGMDVMSIGVDIHGPNIGSTNPRLAPTTIGSISMKLVSGTSRDGLWSGNFSFPTYLPDGNYLYSLTIKDGKGYLTTAGPFSGIILDRNHPDSAETKIVTAIDGEGKTLPLGGTTNSPNVTIVFEGTDKTGVIQSFECNLDDTIIFTEHGHGDDPGQASSPYSSCFDLLKVSAESTGNQSYANLGAGNHTFKVRAIDNENDRDTSPSSFSWSILPPPRPTK
ncbi:hypothetical protein BH18THE2_BH18THE2_10030 [soil metagenome]